MVTMSGNWDRTMEVLSGRSGVLTRIALPALFLPAVVRDGWSAWAGGASPALVAVGGLLAIVAAVVMIWGQLAITAVASDPANTEGDAAAQASRRFLPAIGVYLLLGLAFVVAVLPVVIALAGSGINWAAVSQGQRPDIAPGLAGFLLLYFLVLLVVALLVSARLFVLNPVIVNERLGIGAFGRAWSLTAGLTWRILGVVLLFGIVLLVVSSAAQFVTGILFRLILGAGGAAFAAAVVGAAVTTVYMVIVSVFAAQLYVTRTQRGVADVFA